MPTARYTPRVVRANRRFKNDRDQRIAHHGWFMSHKDGQAIPCKGTLAHPFLELAHMRPDVVRIDPKPPAIQWWNGKEWDRYRARYGVIVRGNSADTHLMVEVELLTDREMASEAEKWRRIRHAFHQEGRRLLIFTNHHILAEPRLTNAIIINSNAGPGIVPAENRDAVLAATQGLAKFTINDLVQNGVLDYPQAYAAVVNLIAAGEFRFAINRQFNGDTPVFRRLRK